MSLYEIKVYPEPCLRIHAKVVDEFSKEFEKLIRSMVDCMYLNDGIGLAAPQIGLGINAFVLDIGDGLQTFVNSEIVEKADKKTKMEEGCLSLPGLQVVVERPKEIKIRAQNEKGDFFIKTYQGLTAKAIQHEMDHLKGKLIIDYLDPVRRFFGKQKISKYKKTNGKKACEVVCDAGE